MIHFLKFVISIELGRNVHEGEREILYARHGRYANPLCMLYKISPYGRNDIFFDCTLERISI